MDVSITIQTQAPAGTSIDFRGATVPFGYLAEDGAVVSRVTYARLFEAIGVIYGAGDGSTTFKLPDSRGRVNVGSGTGASLTNRVLAATGGEENHVLTTPEIPSHTHTQNPHSHEIGKPLDNSAGGATSLGYAAAYFIQAQANPTNNATATNQNTGGDGSHNNMQPFLVVTKAIKY